MAAVKQDLTKNLGQNKKRDHLDNSAMNSNIWLSETINNASGALLTFDAKGNLMLMNKQAETMTGLLKKDVLGKQIEDIFYLIDKKLDDKLENIFQRVILEGTSISIPDHSLLVSTSGLRTSVNGFIRPVLDKFNRVIGATFAFNQIHPVERESEALEKSLSLASALIENSSSIIYIKDLAGKYTLVNDLFIQTFDMPRESILLKSDHDIFPKRLADKLRGDDKRVLKLKYPSQRTDTLEIAGKSHDFLSTIFPLFDLEGHPYAIGGILVDITEHHETRQRLLIHLEHSPLGYVEITPKLEICSWNKSAESIFGYSKKDVLGKHISLILGDVENQDTTKSIENLYEKPASMQIIWEAMTKKRKPISCEWHFAPLINNMGTIYSIAAVFEDVTEREMHALDLIGTNNILHILAKFNRDAPKLSSEFEIMQVLCDMLINTGGYAAAWVGQLDKTDQLIIPLAQAGFKSGSLKESGVACTDNTNDETVMERTLRTFRKSIDRKLNMESNYSAWNIDHLALSQPSAVAFPINLKGGKKTAITLISDSANQFTKIQLNLLLKLSKDLAYAILSLRSSQKRKKLLDERASLEEQLRISQRLESIGIMAGGIAHDFNNILQLIYLYMENIMGDIQADHSSYSDCENVMEAARRARGLVDNIFTFSTQKTYAFRPLAAQHVLKGSVKFIRSILPSSIEISADIDDNCGKILGDPALMHQILISLSNNAAHAMRGTHGKLSITFLEKENGDLPEKEKIVELTIRDSGCGMTPDIKEKIFDPFFTTKEPGEGSGLGLSVIFGIVRDMNGHIYAESKPNEGSSMHIIFPVVPDSEELSLFPDHKKDITSSKILLVDDEKNIARAGKLVIENYGATVELAHDGVEALKIIEKNPKEFDLVITDQIMPKMTGLQLIKKIRGIAPTLPIIFTSGTLEPNQEKNIIDYGNVEYLHKPWLPQQLIDTVIKIQNL